MTILQHRERIHEHDLAHELIDRPPVVPQRLFQWYKRTHPTPFEDGQEYQREK